MTVSISMLEVIDSFSLMTSKQKSIAKLFYLWMRSIEKRAKDPENPKFQRNMTGLWMSINYIASKASCSYDTVLRFLKEYKKLIRKHYRRGKTNSYDLSKDFMVSMKFMDDFGMLDWNRRKLKNWLFQAFRDAIPSSKENVASCDPLCSILRPNPFPYPFFDEVPRKGAEMNEQKNMNCIGNPYLDRLPLSYEEKRKIIRMSFPEVVYFEAFNDYEWYRKNHKVRSLAGFIINRLRAHRRKINVR